MYSIFVVEITNESFNIQKNISVNYILKSVINVIATTII